MEKFKAKFPDGEVIFYKFANENQVIAKIKKHKNNKFTCSIGWEFGKMHNSAFDNLDDYREQDTLNKIKIKEFTKIYKFFKTQKYKSKEMKLLIQAIMIIIHDIKEEIFIQTNIFQKLCK